MDKIKLKINNQIGKITFHHPKANCLSGETINNLIKLLEKADKDPKAKVILIQSEGSKAFCSGASLEGLKKISTINQAVSFFMDFSNLINAIRKLSKFVIARVHGPSVGGGVGLISACDYVFACKQASVRLSELSLGLGPYVIEPAISRKIGTTNFAELSLDSKDWKSSKWAKEKGLFNNISESIDQMDIEIEKKLASFASFPKEASKRLRQLHWKGTDHWSELLPKNAKITAELALSDFSQSIIKSL